MARKKKPGPKPAALSESGKAMLDAIRNCPTPHRLYGRDAEAFETVAANGRLILHIEGGVSPGVNL